MAGPGLLFYSAWGLGYHNTEAERKALGLADRGWDVVYVAGVGLRNPRLRTAGKAVGRLRSGLAPAGARTVDEVQGLRTASLIVVPPRQLAVLRRVNAALVARRLRAVIADWPSAVAWVRWPTPEVVDALAVLAPAGIVYECVDAYHHTPGVTGRWSAIHDAAERALARRATVCVAPNQALAEHLRGQGATDVRIVPHGVDLFARRPPRAMPERLDAAVVGFVGTLDYRLDVGVLRAIALAHPAWRVRLIGPVQEGFDPAALTDLANVSVEAPVAHERLGEVLAGFDAGVMPYVDDPVFRFMAPVKTLELLAAGRPAVARASPALLEHRELLSFADTPAEFVARLEQVLADDSEALAARRRAVAEGGSWDRRLEEVGRIAAEAAGR
jgi:glycosyltransferase involved in cell wall biosynthesis